MNQYTDTSSGKTLSVVIPAYNEGENIGPLLSDLACTLEKHRIPYEIIVVNDASADDTEKQVLEAGRTFPGIRLVNRCLPRGFGRAVQAGLGETRGDKVVIFMGDGSDSPEDIVRYNQELDKGADCVFGNRFSGSAGIKGYPKGKWLVNRMGNLGLQILFRTGCGDMTNAFKGYKTEVIKELSPFHAAGFHLSLEIALLAFIRGYRIREVPVSWKGRSHGVSKLNLLYCIPFYLCTIFRILAVQIFPHSRSGKRRDCNYLHE